jgi:hypothetical protein
VALEKIAVLTAENAQLRQEIARLIGLKGPPTFKPSGMEKASPPAKLVICGLQGLLNR